MFNALCKGGIRVNSVRQDAWNSDEDMVLAEMVLRHIREGSTQLEAFKEVAEQLSRTPAACGFRWNSLIRKSYQSAIEIAKQQRKELKKQQVTDEISNEIKEEQKSFSNENDHNNAIKMVDVISYLKLLQKEQKQLDIIKKENARLTKEVEELKTNNGALNKELQLINEKYQTVREDYKALISIMERARKMIVFEGEDNENITFHMDLNGNLEKVKK
ncbi:RsfA family transcriptional regulator [Bacillus taeanensis]|uniref:RsfA family transcriptional regulator n=1 Tax=Bacillus taeanensis TaxID=273032 RepID=A0A366Y1D2_9BACI|nr:RsfA family transcriptional regulator [Bacillus taeanensis]